LPVIALFGDRLGCLVDSRQPPGANSANSANGARILIVEARYYDDLADLLLAGAMAVLEEAGAEVERIGVPGSLEIPPAVAMAVEAAQRTMVRGLTEKEAKELVRLLQKAIAAGNDLSRAPLRDAATV